MNGRFIISIGIIFLLISCKKQAKLDTLSEEELNTLSLISHINTLEIYSIDDKCGEWGGNEKLILIYRDNFKGQLLADYTEKIKNCDNRKELEYEKTIKRIKLTNQDNKLILESINELCRNKLNSQGYTGNSGIFNHIILHDSSMVISDYPSIELKGINKLVQKWDKK